VASLVRPKKRGINFSEQVERPGRITLPTSNPLPLREEESSSDILIWRKITRNSAAYRAAILIFSRQRNDHGRAAS
jgi:hypothetical protein